MIHRSSASSCKGGATQHRRQVGRGRNGGLHAPHGDGSWHDAERNKAAARHSKVATATRAVDVNAHEGRGRGGRRPAKRLKPGSGHHGRYVCLAWLQTPSHVFLSVVSWLSLFVSVCFQPLD